ncbi:hypothetical protein [Enterococcus faecalis]|uniref:hypothetical protein n=1 Tax=Enterococcus faecalis TaxID=1351 RepID=UPI000459C525|nr:hypothetical protein [Enterococcus faecalis]KAJ86932.1 hypothetical protein P791_0008 [Enterococcus faecalis NY9]
MKVKKIMLDSLHACYAVCRIYNDSHDYLLVASETENACYAYDVKRNFQKSIVWDIIGGTMSIIQVPDTLDFLATQKFYPGFDAKECQIVYGRFCGEGKWDIQKVMIFPYLHRFDLVKSTKGIFFIGCTIANSKRTIEDWSDDGKVFVGKFNQEKKVLESLRELPIRLKKNHGYYKRQKDGYSLITATEGVFCLTYPDFSDSKDWKLEKIFEEETSDIAQIDINQDNYLENIVIQGFHGNRFRILDYQFKNQLYRYSHESPFGHALWAGELLEQPIILFGYREGKKDLLAFSFKNGIVTKHLIENDVASSNCLAFVKDNKNYVFSANNGINQVCLYELEQEV